MEHYHIYRPREFPPGSGRVMSYEMVEISFEARTSANRYARQYDDGALRSMVRQCDSAYCAIRQEELYAEDA